MSHLPRPPDPSANPPRATGDRSAKRDLATLPGHGQVQFQAGAQPGQAQLTVSDLQGRSVELEIEFTAQGPKVKLSAASLQLQTPGALDIECEDFRVRASHSIDLQTQGDLNCTAQGYARSVARGLSMRATHGSIQAKANDDVQLLGETILLNCERPQPRPVWAPKLDTASTTLEPQAQAGELDIIEQLR